MPGPEGNSRVRAVTMGAMRRRGVSVGLVFLLGALAGVASLALDLVTRGTVGPGRVAVRAQWGEGRTELRLPPLGQISADTHWAPVTLTAEVEQVDLDQLGDVLGSASPEELLRRQVSADLDPLLRSFAQRAAITAAAAGALAGALVRRRRWFHCAAGLAGGVTAVALLLGGAWAGYDAERFDEARFQGPLERAPDLLATVRRHVDGFDDVQERFGELGDQMAELYALASTDGRMPTSADEVRILHVTDIHSNPLGVEVARQLAERFEVDAVLDTGDLTSFGLPLEAARLGELIAGIPVRYLFVPGNHDSEANKAALDAIPNVELLDGTVADVGGISVLGIADPTFTATNEISAGEARTIKEAAAPSVRAAVETHEPDVLAVHDPVMAKEAHGRVRLVVAGHVHKRTVEHSDGTVVLTAGSTGSTGLGSFTVETGRSYEAQILRFVDGKLAYVDRVALSGAGGGFSVQRELIAPADTQMAGEGEHVTH
ncbi:MAG: metallophosphoesterase family protein [Acidimicrobiia bacterium]